MLPASVGLSFFITSPLLFIIALIPLLVDLTRKVSFSTDLKIALAKCWYGPTELPNQPSSEILIIKLVFLFDC